MAKVLNAPTNHYTQWRAQSLLTLAMAEKPVVPLLNERLLQLVWQHQRIRRDMLRTIDGQTLNILHPGFWNRESGPDFKRAVVQIGQSWPRTGDVEIDLSPHGWRNHRHDCNPAYREVILHVVWEARSQETYSLPTLSLSSQLDAPLEELAIWLSDDRASIPPPVLGQCCPPLRNLSNEAMSNILSEAAQSRLQAKAAQFKARARQVGWEQALFEGLLGALGYKNNVWPMRRIAELIPLLLQHAGRSAQPIVWQSRLLGLSGLMPSELPSLRAAADSYLRSLWDIWWRERERFADLVLPRELWQLHGLRPANHPQRRLALAAHWLAAGDLPARLEQWFAKDIADSQLLGALLEALQADTDPFWSRHWTFHAPIMPRQQPLLGPQRATDLAVNVVLPWLWVRALSGNNDQLRSVAESRYFAWPKAEDNAVLKLARRRLFGCSKPAARITAANQQGVLQIVRDFCQHSNALCDHCQFPALVAAAVSGE
jgi:hypothetical protein